MRLVHAHTLNPGFLSCREVDESVDPKFGHGDPGSADGAKARKLSVI
jgi:hypothetical protein